MSTTNTQKPSYFTNAAADGYFPGLSKPLLPFPPRKPTTAPLFSPEEIASMTRVGGISAAEAADPNRRFGSSQITRDTFFCASPMDLFRAIISPKSRPYDAILAGNFVLAGAHLAIAIAFTFFYIVTFHKVKSSSVVIEDKSILPFPLYRHTSQGASEKVVTFEARGVATACVLFFAITAAAHMYYAYNYNGVYITSVAQGVMPWRWIEYGITATIMAGIIALTSGVRDVNTFVLIIAANIGMIGTGAWFELGGGWLSIVVGFVLLAAISSAVITSFNDRVTEAQKEDAKIPNWIRGAVFATLAFFGCFGVVPVVQILSRGAIPYYYFEMVYMVLSAVAKITLGSFVAYGVGARVNAELKDLDDGTTTS